ncbi:MAG: hypothetical protein JNJ56_02640 [Ignavibacteria bacterium]|nr:hypothetical protein [Ignavibacteria bacterium]
MSSDNTGKFVFGSDKAVYLFLILLNTALLFPSLFIPFFGDDFAWLLQSETFSGQSLYGYIFSPAPFGYFRPVPKLFFYILSSVANNSAFYFHAVILILHITVSVLVFRFAVSLKYSHNTAFISALIFSVLTCHSETLFFINCINEIFSAVFILSGLYIFTRKESPLNYLFVLLMFILAMLSRESAVCYIPLLILVNLRTKKLKSLKLIVYSLIPVFVYAAVRIYSEKYFTGSNINLMSDSLDLNPLKALYKTLHYFVNMIFPVKMIFAITGYDKLEFLIHAFRRPSENILVFFLLSFSVSLVCFSLIFLFIRKLGTEIFFPLLFIFFAIFIYLFSFNTAERYLYLPSAGLSILLGLFFDKCKSGFIFRILLALYLLVHSASLVIRLYDYKEASYYSQNAVKVLNEKTNGISSGSVIYFENIPPKKNGIYFLSPYNLQPNYDFNFPERKYEFLFRETISAPDSGRINAVIRFNNERDEFERLR